IASRVCGSRLSLRNQYDTQTLLVRDSKNVVRRPARAPTRQGLNERSIRLRAPQPVLWDRLRGGQRGEIPRSARNDQAALDAPPQARAERWGGEPRTWTFLWRFFQGRLRVRRLV